MTFRKNKKIFSEAVFIILGKLLAIGVQVLGVRFLTAQISPNLFGEFSVILTFSALAELLFGILSQAITRYYFVSKTNNEYKVYKKVSLELIFKIALLTSGGYIILSFFSYSIIDCFLLLGFTFFSSMNSLISGIQNAERQRQIVIIHEILDKLFRSTFAIMFLIYFDKNLTSMLLGYTFGTFLVFLSQTFYYKTKIENKLLKNTNNFSYKEYTEYKKKIISYSVPFLIWVFFTWAQNSSDKWFLNFFLSSKEVGLYQPLNQFGFQFITLGIGMINTLILPIIFEKAGDGVNVIDIKKAVLLNNKITIGIILPLLCMVMFSFFFHRQIYSIIVAPEYREISYLLPYMMIGGALFAIGQQFSNNFAINFNPRKIMLPKIVTAIFGIIFNVISIYSLGIKGLIISICLTQLIYATWLFSLSQKYILK